MSGKEITILSWEAQPELSLDELCEACHVTHEFIQQLVEYGAIDPIGFSIEVWRFHPGHIQKVQMVMRLQRDLEVNLPAVALVLDLKEQLEQLRAELAFLEKHVRLGQKQY